MEADVIIAVMGATGVGKSTFIKTITGREDIAVGHGLFSGTPRHHPKSLRSRLTHARNDRGESVSLCRRNHTIYPRRHAWV